MLYPDRNIKQRKDETLKGSLDVFNEDHFSDVIKRLFDVYVRHPNEKTGKIIKQAFQDYITVISFIKNEAGNNNTYESIIQTIGNEFGEHIKKIANTEELKRYFEIAKESKELFETYKDPKILLKILRMGSTNLLGEITVTYEEDLLCFVCDDRDMRILCDCDEHEQTPNGVLIKRSLYNNKSLPIILLRKDNPDIAGTKAHEIQHYINNIFFMKDNGMIDKDNIEEIIGLRFKDEILAQAIHSTKVITSNGEETNEAITFYNDINTPNSYDFPFRSLVFMVANSYKKRGKKIDLEDVKSVVKIQYRNDYMELRDIILREEFDYTDRIYFARDMLKNIEEANFILALTPFDNRKDLKNIYKNHLG